MEPAVIYVVDDDGPIRGLIRSVLEEEGWTVEDYADCEAFLESYRPGRQGCLLVDAYLPGMSGLELLQRLKDVGSQLPSVMITGNSDVHMAVQAMKAGASDFIEKPIGHGELLATSGAQSSTQAIRPSCPLGDRKRRATSPASRRDSARSWTWFLPATPARTSPRTLASANGPSKTTAPKS